MFNLKERKLAKKLLKEKREEEAAQERRSKLESDLLKIFDDPKKQTSKADTIWDFYFLRFESPESRIRAIIRDEIAKHEGQKKQEKKAK